MKKFAMLFVLTVLVGCKSIELPPIEESEKKINQYSIELRQAERDLDLKQIDPSGLSDLNTKINRNAINKIFNAIANQRNDDVKIQFLSTPNVISEEKNYLGVKFSNYLNINKGNIDVNLKTLQLEKVEKNKLYAKIELEGKGKIEVAGKYMSVASTITPEVNLYLNEQIVFEILPGGDNEIRIKPMKKTMILKTKTSINFLNWSVPWKQDVPLELDQLISPIDIPASLNTEFNLPVPSSAGANQFDQKPYTLQFKSPKVSTNGDYIEFKTNVDIKAK